MSKYEMEEPVSVMAMNSRHFVLCILLFIDICLYLRLHACDILELSVTNTFFGLVYTYSKDYHRRQ